MVQQRAQRPALARLVRQADQLPGGLREQAVERLLQRALRRVERRRLALATGVVMLQPRPVQAVDRSDPLDPSLAPARQSHLAGRALDKIAAHMGPTECKGHFALAKASESLVGAIAVADDDRVEESVAEQLLRRLGAARGVDMERDRVIADRDPQPGAARPVFPAKFLDAPAGLVGMAQRRLVLVRKDRLGQRLEQRHEPLQAVGQRPRRDRQPLGGHPRGNTVHGAEAGTVLEQEACPEAGPVERPGEQQRHRGRRHFHGRRRALAGPAPARTADHALVGLDLDLDEGGFLGAVRRIGLPAPAADARIRRRVVLFGALIEPGPLGAAVAGRAALLAALVFRARLVLLLALAAVERPRQHRPGRTKPLKLDFQRLDPVPRRLRALAQAGVLPGQRLDRSLLAPRPSQSPAEIGVCNGQRLRQRLPDRPKPGKLGLECLPDRAKLGRLNRQRRFPGLQLPHGPAQTGVALAQRLDRRLLTPRPPQRRAQLGSLVGRQLRQHRPGRPKLGEPGLQLLLPGPGHLQGMAQPEDLVGQRSGPGLAVAQYPHLPMEPKGLAGQLLRGLPDALRPLLLLVEARVQPGVLLVPPDHLLVEPAEFRAKRPDGLPLVRGRLQDGAPPGRSGGPHGPVAPSRAFDAARALRSRAFSLRSAPAVSKADAMPASERSVSRRATSACKDGTSLAVRRASFVSSTASLSLRRQALNRDFHEPPSLRAATSAQRSSFRARFGRVRPRPFPLTL